MGKLILAPPRGDTRSQLWIKSFAGTFLGVICGLINAEFIYEGLTPHVLALPCAITVGACIAGAFQGIGLRVYTRPALQWIALSLLGWWLAFGSIWLLENVTMRPPAPTMIVTVIGVLTSLPQRHMLRRHIDRSGIWVLINVLCWWLIGYPLIVFLY